MGRQIEIGAYLDTDLLGFPVQMRIAINERIKVLAFVSSVEYTKQCWEIVKHDTNALERLGTVINLLTRGDDQESILSLLDAGLEDVYNKVRM